MAKNYMEEMLDSDYDDSTFSPSETGKFMASLPSTSLMNLGWLGMIGVFVPVFAIYLYLNRNNRRAVPNAVTPQSHCASAIFSIPNEKEELLESEKAEVPRHTIPYSP